MSDMLDVTIPAMRFAISPEMLRDCSPEVVDDWAEHKAEQVARLVKATIMERVNEYRTKGET